MKPAITLFYKEFRQHGVFALAMVILCLLFQVATYESGRWSGNAIPADMYLFIALIVTALYAAATAALAYSTEHADNTYTFLRKLPISTTSVALGKIGWMFCGTILVLLGNSLLAAVWILPGNINAYLVIAFGLTILEMLIWGLFWSTRCRSQVHAIIAGIACASFSAWFIAAVFSPFKNDSVMFYYAVVPHRLAFIAVIAIFAVWGALRWFAYDSQSPWPKVGSRLPTDYGFLRYPHRVQHPFLALVHQHVRHASILYHLGIASFILWSLGFLILCVPTMDLLAFHQKTLEFIQVGFGFSAIVSMFVMLLFWGNIFGHDQKNDSYRFLSRLGIHAGTVWWSRMALPLLLYLAVIACALLLLFVSIPWGAFVILWPNWVAFWLAPLAMGAFFSISFRSQMVAIALTIAGTLTLLGWMNIFLTLFGSSPLWTTLPIALALLLASRLRATYWLRETYTWRSRLVPLVPFFVVMLAIPVALPFVRVYSVPYVSWAQIERYFDNTVLPVYRAPAKRDALLRHIAKHGTVPPEYEAMYDKSWPRSIRLNVPEGLTYEEYLLLRYAEELQYSNRLFSGQLDHFSVSERNSAKQDRRYYARYMPWEKAREERILRLWLVSTLFDASTPFWMMADTENFIWLRYVTQKMAGSDAVFDQWVYYMYDDLPQSWYQYRRMLGKVSRAIERWYAEHGTLPESLDDLVGTYLDKIPVLPFTDEPVVYYVNAPPPHQMGGRHVMSPNFRVLGGEHVFGTDARERRAAFEQHGGTYLSLGNHIDVLLEPQSEQSEPRPEERDYELTP